MGTKGYGVVATCPLPAHTFVIEYLGEVIPSSLVPARLAAPAPHHYLLTLTPQLVVDASMYGGVGRFINHACNDNNCVTEKWTVGGRERVGIFTCREVQAGEELTFDYQWQRKGGDRVQCRCGKRKCKGWLGKEEKGKPKKRARAPSRPTRPIDDSSDEEKADRVSSPPREGGGRVRVVPRSSGSFADTVYRERVYVSVAERWVRWLDGEQRGVGEVSSLSSSSSTSVWEERLLARCRAARVRQLDMMLDELDGDGRNRSRREAVGGEPG